MSTARAIGSIPLALILLHALACSRGRPETPFGDEVEYADSSDSLPVRTLISDGGRVDWSHERGLIAFDREGEDGWFDVWVMTPDADDQRCVTCAIEGLPTRHVGQPAWSPDGRWLVFQAEAATSDASKFAAHPGRGVNNELWAMDFDEQTVFALTPTLDMASEGVLHAHFSADGGSLTWSNMLGPARLGKAELFGSWELVHADFAVDGGVPSLGGFEAVAPGGSPRFYENHGWSPDGVEWVFSANLDLDKGVGELNDIYLWDRAEEILERFTTGGYNEHASFSPDGEQLMWISNAGNDNNGTDLWRARRDGSELERLTRLNTEDSGRRVAADLSWGPAGESVVLYVQDEVLGAAGSVVIIDGL